MKIAILASEVSPFARTGGLADVTAALPKALTQLGHDVRIIMPLYRGIDRKRFGLRAVTTVSVRVGSTVFDGCVWEAPAGIDTNLATTYLIECAPLFDRTGLYQSRGTDYPDNLQRFSFFSQAALRILPVLGWQPDVIHCHDWHTALACAHLAWTPLRQDPFFASIGTVFTIHNIAYQGLFPKTQWPQTGLPERVFSVDGLEDYRQINLLKGGLIACGIPTTVSPTYAQEIHTAEFGRGLEDVVATRRDLVGILNGIDPDAWDPRTDPHIASHYSVDQLAGKSVCKLTLQRAQKLPTVHDFVIGMVQRLTEQKGMDIFARAVEELAQLPIQVVVLGLGDPKYQTQLKRLAKRFPDRLAVSLTFNEVLAHRIEAGADAFLIPSRFEPCGLTQFYSMRFGTVPIVRKVGGLADTVCDVNAATRADRTATGFVFESYTSAALVDVVKRAMTAFSDHALWTDLMRTGMRQDFSWTRSACAYAQVYEQAMTKARSVERRRATDHLQPSVQA